MSSQQVIQNGNRAVVINVQGEAVWANLYVNARDGIRNADITNLRWSGKTVTAAKKWAAKVMA